MRYLLVETDKKNHIPYSINSNPYGTVPDGQ